MNQPPKQPKFHSVRGTNVIYDQKSFLQKKPPVKQEPDVESIYQHRKVSFQQMKANARNKPPLDQPRTQMHPNQRSERKTANEQSFEGVKSVKNSLGNECSQRSVSRSEKSQIMKNSLLKMMEESSVENRSTIQKPMSPERAEVFELLRINRELKCQVKTI